MERKALLISADFENLTALSIIIFVFQIRNES